LDSSWFKKFVSQKYGEQMPSVGGKSWPKISVVTPSYNQAQYIERTLLSVLNQQYPHIEYIVVDDKSPDHSNDIIQRYSPAVKLLGDGTNRGQTAAINYGLRHATGDLVTFQNADDLFGPNAFWEVAKAYQQTPNASVFFGNLCIIDEHDIIQNEMWMTPFSLEEQLALGMQVYNQALFFKRDLLESAGYLDEKYNYSFDYEIVLRFATTPHVQLHYVKGLWGGFRIHSQSKTSNITPSYQNERLAIRDFYQQKLKVFPNPRLVRVKSYLRKALYLVGSGQLRYLFHRLFN
jgi:glycosyltransferase involved in cell wall biosynthesis